MPSAGMNLECFVYYSYGIIHDIILWSSIRNSEKAQRPLRTDASPHRPDEASAVATARARVHKLPQSRTHSARIVQRPFRQTASNRRSGLIVTRRSLRRAKKAASGVRRATARVPHQNPTCRFRISWIPALSRRIRIRHATRKRRNARASPCGSGVAAREGQIVTPFSEAAC